MSASKDPRKWDEVSVQIPLVYERSLQSCDGNIYMVVNVNLPSVIYLLADIYKSKIQDNT